MGLIGGMARTAVVAGTATAVSNRVSRRQANRWAAQEQPQAGGMPRHRRRHHRHRPACSSQPERHARCPAEAGRAEVGGVLTEAEFQAQKARILAGG